MQQDNTNQSIQNKLRQDALSNVGKQDVQHEETPTWISSTSWGIGIIVAIIVKIAIVANMDRMTSEGIFFPLIAAIIAGLIAKVSSHAIILGLCSAAKSAKQGVSVVAKSGSKKIDSITSAVAEKVTRAIENGKNNARLDNEKELLRQKVNDLELQQLKKRISELEEKLKNK